MAPLYAGNNIGNPLLALFERVEALRQAVESGGWSNYYPRLFVDDEGYISADYGEVMDDGE